MIEIKVDKKGKAVEVDAKGEIKGYDNAISQFVAVLCALDKMSEDVLCDAVGEFISMKKGDKDDDESES